MAKMYPDRLPDQILENPIYKGEIQAFDALSTLPEDFDVFYNRSPYKSFWRKAFQKKIDFIVLHEKHGILAIEVKGGSIRLKPDGSVEQYHHSKRSWTRIDPYAQVERAMRDFIMTIKTDGATYWIPDNTCVLFPNTERRDLTDVPHTLEPGTLCADDMPLLKILIPKLLLKGLEGSKWSREIYLDIKRRLQTTPRGKTISEHPMDIKSNVSTHKPQAMLSQNIKKEPENVYIKPLSMDRFKDHVFPKTDLMPPNDPIPSKPARRFISDQWDVAFLLFAIAIVFFLTWFIFHH